MPAYGRKTALLMREKFRNAKNKIHHQTKLDFAQLDEYIIAGDKDNLK